MNFYNFKTQLGKSSQKEAVILCMKYAADHDIPMIDVSENPTWFEKGVDLIEKLGERQITIDVKCDEIISKSGNVAIELVEIASSKGFIKKGWGLGTVDYIFYVDWKNKTNYIFKLSRLIEATFNSPKVGFAAYHPQEKYFTLGVLVPLNELTPDKIWKLSSLTHPITGV